MAREVVSVTVEYLDKPLADGTYGQCKGRVTVRVLGVVLVRLRRCRRRAVAVITVSCSRHGACAPWICLEHLLMLRADPEAVVCSGCGRRAGWSVAQGRVG